MRCSPPVSFSLCGNASVKCASQSTRVRGALTPHPVYCREAHVTEGLTWCVSFPLTGWGNVITFPLYSLTAVLRTTGQESDMLKRMYVDNFRTLVNFDLEFGPLTLLLGPNGSGKTTAFEVVCKLRDFVCEDRTATDLFPTSTLTRWQSSRVQTLEIELGENDDHFTYRLEIQHELQQQKCRVSGEKLLFNGKPLFQSQFERGQLHARLYRDESSAGPEVLVDGTRSGVASIQPRHDNQKITVFKDCMRRVQVSRIEPMLMGARAEKEASSLAWNASNFVEWFRHAASLDLELATRLRPTLTDVLSGFDGLSLIPDGSDAKLLKVKFSASNESGEAVASSYECRFDELSDGQKALFVLYTLLLTSDGQSTLVLDEPENFLALREVQPWLNEILDLTQRGAGQVVLISHHPYLIDALAMGCGRWLDRAAGGPTRVQKISEDGSGLSISELVSRGWLHA
jgi:energy-coupling factor transporter ATP-binding protein EcfA2